MKTRPQLQGEPLIQDSRKFGPFINDTLGREVVKKVNSTLAGTPAELQVPSKKGPITHSNLFRLFAIDYAAREEHGIRVMLPPESELLLAQERLPEAGSAYYDLGLVMDFSGRNHDLALRLYEQLPAAEKTLERLPSVLTGLRTVRCDLGNYGLGFDYTKNSILRTAKILQKPTDRFNADDPELVRSGLPSRLGEGTRTLYTAEQSKPRLENLGLYRLSLDRDLSLSGYWGDLDDSDEWGRVVLVSDEVAQKNLEKVTSEHMVLWNQERKAAKKRITSRFAENMRLLRERERQALALLSNGKP